MDNFEQYLQSIKMTTSTIESHCYNVKLFMQWLNYEKLIDAAYVCYNDLLAYIQHEKSKNVAPATGYFTP